MKFTRYDSGSTEMIVALRLEKVLRQATTHKSLEEAQKEALQFLENDEMTAAQFAGLNFFRITVTVEKVAP